jgi:acyl-CoA thioesterase
MLEFRFRLGPTFSGGNSCAVAAGLKPGAGVQHTITGERSLPASLCLQEAGEGRFTIPIDSTISTGLKQDRHLFGGAAVGAAIVAMEQLSGQETIWACAQFQSLAKVGQVLELAETARIAGRSISQFSISAQVEGTTVMQLTGATGATRPHSADRDWIGRETMPDIATAKFVQVHHDAHEDIHGRFEARQVKGRFGKFSHDPRSADRKVEVWFKPLKGEVDRASLAMLADFVPATSSDALGIRSGGRSIDNHIRFGRFVPTEWVLAEFNMVALAHGTGFGQSTLYAEDGTVLAVGSQSFRISLSPRAGESGIEG